LHARQTVAERQRTKGFMTTLVSYWKSNDTEREEISKRQIRSRYMYYRVFHFADVEWVEFDLE